MRDDATYLVKSPLNLTQRLATQAPMRLGLGRSLMRSARVSDCLLRTDYGQWMSL